MPESVCPFAGTGGKFAWNAKNRIRDSVLIQNFPESLALPELFGTSAAERNHPTAEMNRVLRPLTREVEKYGPVFAGRDE